jgi:hypothetical protein
MDGKGRRARLGINLILFRHGFTLAILKGINQDGLNY